MSDLNKAEQLQQAEAAARILEEPVVVKALASMRTIIAEQMWSDAVHQNASPERRARLDALAWAAGNFENCLRVMVNGGEIIKSEMLMAENMKVKADLYDIRKVRYG